MFNIDKQKFSAFIATLRKEKGMTQKELAVQLFISDKAISKWETAASVPNIDLLIPLSEILGVTVTELLMCQRMEQDNALNTMQVEQVVKTVISYSEEEQTRAYHKKSKWGLIYVLSLSIACLEVWFSYMEGKFTSMLLTPMVLGAIFGAYFCFFVKEKLPAYYDENRICTYSDGAFRMNMPGLAFNNNNWEKILNASRIWAVSILPAYPVISYVVALFFTGFWQMMIELHLTLLLVLGGLLIPIYIVGRKYE